LISAESGSWAGMTAGANRRIRVVLAVADPVAAKALAAHAAKIPSATKQKVLDTYGKLPLSFEVNRGQNAPQVKFLARGTGYTLYLTSREELVSFVVRA